MTINARVRLGALAVLSLAGVVLRAEQLPIKNYTTVDGLRNASIGCIMQDPYGFMWFCTYAGVSRFDGYTFTNYGPEQGLPDRSVTSLAVTGDGAYWAGTYATGLFRFNPKTSLPQKFEPVQIGASDNSRSITALLVDHSGVLWVGTREGLYRLEGPDRIAFRSIDLLKKDVFVSALAEDRHGTLWIGGVGVVYRHNSDGRLTKFSDHRFDAIETLYADREERLWVGTRYGLFRLNANAGAQGALILRTYLEKDGLPSPWVNSLLETSGGELWAGTAGGLGRYLPLVDQFKSYTPAQGLSDNDISSLFEDGDGNLWAGTKTSGLMKIAYRGFTSYTQAEGLGSAYIRSIFLAQTAGLCVETRSSAPAAMKLSLACFDGKRFTSVLPKYPNHIQDFGWGWNQTTLQDHAGEWWVPTGEGLCWFGKVDRLQQLSGKTPRMVFTTQNGLPGNNIFRLFEDSRGDIWISTNELTRWDRTTRLFHVYSTAHGLPENYGVTAFAEDRSGQIWMGLNQGGLGRFRNGHFTLYSQPDDPGAGMIMALYLDHSGGCGLPLPMPVLAE